MHVLSRLYRGETRINFIGSRRYWYLASGILIVICVLSFIFRGFNYGVEFKGGVSFQIQSADTGLTSSQVNTAFSHAGVAPAEPPQVVGSGSTQSIVVNTKVLDAAEVQGLRAKVASELHISQDKMPFNSVGTSWGHETTVDALKGLIIFLVVVSIYVSLRFEWRMAVGGMLALLHDLIVAAGIYSLVGFEVTPSTIVGLLTILGFSLYDTVVVYDKVRENAKDILASSRMTFAEAANLAVNQTLMRSINTSLIALLPCAGLLFVGAGLLGVGTIEDLALILFVGLAVGAYSSLFLATPIVVDLTERDPRYKSLTKRVMAKRASEAKRAEAELAGASTGSGGGGKAAAPSRRNSGPAPAPKVGARPERRPKRK